MTMNTSKLFSIAAAATAALAFAGIASAAPIITVGAHNLLPNTPNQPVTISVSGGDAVQGVNFEVQVADGGPEAGAALGNGSHIDGPSIQSVDILTGTIFGPNNTGPGGAGGVVPQFYEATTTTASSTVSANGLLATILLDTTGFTSGTFELRLANTVNGTTDFSGVPATITNGSVSIVPEPGTLGLAGVGIASGLLARRRRAARA
jgi:hypothetical protein